MNEKTAAQLDDHLPAEVTPEGMAIGDGGFSRRRMLAYLISAPTLTVGIRSVGDLLAPQRGDAAASELAAGSGPLPATPGVPDGYDLTDALTQAALPTTPLMVLTVNPDGTAVFRLPRAEVGQGITTAFAMIVAEELDAALADVRIVLEDARPELLFNQITGGSNSIHALYTPVRLLAAAARARLVTAAAQRFGVGARTLTTRDSVVRARDGRTATYASLAVAAAGIATPAIPGIPKAEEDFRVIGQPRTRLDVRDIVTGKAEFTLDLDAADAKPTVVARPPTLKGTVRTLDASVARRMPGVLAVTQIPTGVAVTAQNFHQAEKARDALRITWNPGPLAGISDSNLRDQLAASSLPFAVPPLGAITIDRTFDMAFIPHAPLEVLNCVADVRSDRAEIWMRSKTPIIALQKVAEAVGLPESAVTFHVIRGGGSFGRGLFFDSAIEAARISKAIRRPVKLMWTRSDDMRHGRMRPRSHHKVRATHLLGNVIAYEHRMSTTEVDYRHGLGEAITAGGFDANPIGVSQSVYLLTQKVPYNFGVESQLLNELPLPFPTSSFRSIYSGQNAMLNEVMVDEMARAFGKDPMAYRRQVASSDRTKALLTKLAAKGKWGRRMPTGTAQGVAIHEEYKGVVGYIAEIDCRTGSNPRVTRATCVVDVGRAINPRGLAAQMQGVFHDGLSATLMAGVHIDDGAVREDSYTDFRYARMRHSPTVVNVHVMPPNGEPGGAGELGFPAAAAAVANAYARATGTTPSRFPISF